MTHLPFVAASYALGIVLPGAFALAAWRRMGVAARRLAAIDTRRPIRQRIGDPARRGRRGR
ncbi:MAG: hypothetical protein FWD12_00710 [Alphaproteobacteria bacterium]|nr:hypothetical protein [Alphaproteobacteria bacterium]